MRASVSRLGAALAGAAVLALAAPAALAAQSTTQTFDGGGTAFTRRNYGGTAAAVLGGGPTGNLLRLAYAGSSNTLNVAAFDRTFVGAPASIVAEFDFRIGGGSRADGLGFALLNTATFGTAGAASIPQIAVEDPNFANSIGIGFDTFSNGEGSNNHVSLHYNGSLVQQVNLDPAAFDLANNAFNRARVAVTFGVAGAAVSLDITPNGGSAFNAFNLLLAGVQAYESRVAFGARTGGQTDNHDVDNVNVQFTPSSTVPEPTTVVLLGGGLALLGVTAARRRGA